MAQDPRRFLVKNCGKATQRDISKQTNRKSFFGNQGPIGQIGDLEVLNETKTGGRIGEGLRALASSSDLIRTGQQNPSILSNLTEGENQVLDSVGINPASMEQASRLNPDVANRALGQARSIYQQVQQGNFTVNDIPEALADFQNLETLISGIYTPPQENTKLYEQCGASPYAIDLIAFAPKFKYMFIVQFEYAEPYKDMADLDHAFVIKTSTRPTVQFEYDDINMYNYRTKVAKSVNYDPMTMTFIDDDLNHANKFYNTYLRAMSPISNMRFDQHFEDQGLYDETGMDFDGGLNQGNTSLKNGSVTSHSYSASLGPLIGDETKNILKRITLFHVYSYGRLMNVYRFYNPKILTMELDQLDMAESGPSELSIQFSYDAVNILNDYEVNPEAIRGETPAYNIEQLSGRNRAQYPITWNSGPNSVDVNPDVGPTAQEENN